jgi:hypothetical protein
MCKVSRIASQRVVGGTVVVRVLNTDNNVSRKRVDGDLRPSIRFGSAAGAFVYYYAVTRGYRDQDRHQYCRSHENPMMLLVPSLLHRRQGAYMCHK